MAMQQVKAGVPAIYLSGWQVAARRQRQPLQCIRTSRDGGLERADRGEGAINNALMRADQIQHMEGKATSISSRPSWPTPRRDSRRAQCVRADEIDDRGGRGPACTSRTSSLR